MPNWSVGEDIGAGRLVELTFADADVLCERGPGKGIGIARCKDLGSNLYLLNILIIGFELHEQLIH
jgi:hypothetical protein